MCCVLSLVLLDTLRIGRYTQRSMKKTILTPLKDWAIKNHLSYSGALKYIQDGRLKAQRLGRYWYVVEEIEAPAGEGVVLTLFTHAGGSGKTSIARDLGYELASRGKRVLLVDVDPQANLSAWLGIMDPPIEDTLLGLLEHGRTLKPKEVLPGLSVIPSHVELARAELMLVREPYKMFALRKHLDTFREEYDLILVDSLPSLGSLAGIAGVAGDGLLVPVEASSKGLQALPTVLSVAKDYAEGLASLRMGQPGPFVRALIPNSLEGTVRDREVLAQLSVLGEHVPVSPGLTRRPAVYREAQVQGVPIQAVGGEEVSRELAALGDFIESQVLSPLRGKMSMEVS